MDKVITFLNKTIADNDKVVIACSGGPDSMCLLSLLCSLEKKINIIVAHVNHNLRKESIDEKTQVERFCKKNSLIFEYKEFDFKDGFSEGLAHKKRYEFFKDIIEKYNADYLLTAHHGNDLIETILMRIARGSNLSGYVGIKMISDNKKFKILRPLLYVTKEDIITYCDKNKIAYSIDKSNNDIKYTRNRYRSKILPLLKEEDYNIHLKYLKFSQELEEYDNFIKEYVDNLKVINSRNEINLNLFEKESEFIQRKIIESVVKTIQASEWFDISDNQVKEIFKLLNSRKNTIDLNNGYKAIKTSDKLIIERISSEKEFSYILNQSIVTDNWNISIVRESKDDSNNVIRLNSKELTMPLIVRNRIEGDKIAVKNLNGHKKIKDILIDEKIDIRKRQDVPILIDSSGIVLWVAGLKKSKFAKNKDEKYDIIIKYETRREKKDDKK